MCPPREGGTRMGSSGGGWGWFVNGLIYRGW